jgi:hypothetical protein
MSLKKYLTLKITYHYMYDPNDIMDFLQINVDTQRGFVSVNGRIRAINTKGDTVCCKCNYELILNNIWLISV